MMFDHLNAIFPVITLGTWEDSQTQEYGEFTQWLCIFSMFVVMMTLSVKRTYIYKSNKIHQRSLVYMLHHVLIAPAKREKTLRCGYFSELRKFERKRHSDWLSILSPLIGDLHYMIYHIRHFAIAVLCERYLYIYRYHFYVQIGSLCNKTNTSHEQLVTINIYSVCVCEYMLIYVSMSDPFVCPYLTSRMRCMIVWFLLAFDKSEWTQHIGHLLEGIL